MAATETVFSGKKKMIVGFIILFVLVIAAVVFFLFGREKGYRTISISELFGDVMAETNGNEFEAYPDMHLKEGHALNTYQESYVRMALDEDKYVKLEENSRAEFRTLGASDSGNTVIYLDRGAITNEITRPLGEDESYVVHTPNAVLAVRGTFFRVEVKIDKKGEVLTDIYTYGGEVSCKRVLPNGETVEEKVLVSQGYCTTVSMDETHTVYVIEEIVPDRENVQPIHKDRIPEKDLVEVYVAALHGHEMFLPVEEIWEEIETREIKIEEHVSQYDKTPIPVYEISEPMNEASNDPSELQSVEEFELISPTERIQENETAEENHLSGLNTEMLQQIPNEPMVDSVLEVPEVIVSGPSVDVEEDDDDSHGSSGKVESDKDDTVADVDKEESNDGGSAGDEQENPDAGTEHVHTEVTETQAATCTASGKTIMKCSVCGEVLTETEIDALGHAEVTNTQAATCTVPGKTTVTCSVCGDVITETEIDALGHTKVSNTQAATCTVPGKTTVTCSVCGDTISETVIPALPHTEVTENTATCTTAGVTTVSCSVCQQVISETSTPAKGHGTSATKIENGEKITYCTVCNDIISRENVVLLDDTNFPDQTFREYIVVEFDSDGDSALTEAEIMQVKTIDISDKYVFNLQGLAYFTELTELNCSNRSSLYALDVSSNTKLTSLNCSNTAITHLDLSQNKQLISLDFSKSDLAYLDLTENTKLENVKSDSCEMNIVFLNPTTEYNLGSVRASDDVGLDITKVSNVYYVHKDSDTGTSTNIQMSYNPAEGKLTDIPLGIPVLYDYKMNDTFSARFSILFTLM